MLSEAPNNNDVKRVANIVLNEAPNSNDATRVGNKCALNRMGAQQFSMVAMYVAIMQKSRLTRDERL